jgi:hypothetical protein
MKMNIITGNKKNIFFIFKINLFVKITNAILNAKYAKYMSQTCLRQAGNAKENLKAQILIHVAKLQISNRIFNFINKHATAHH